MSKNLQHTADDVATAMDYSLNRKETPPPEPPKMLQDLSGFMNRFRLPDIETKKKPVPVISQTEKVLTDSVLYQYAYLDKLLKECNDERGPARGSKRALS